MKKVSVSKSKSKKMEDTLQLKQESIGLCSCCKSVQTCTYPKNPRRPILQCEEFDGILPSPLKIVPFRNLVPESFPGAFTSVQNDSNPYRGLCSLCENHGTCTYPKPEGGVWHCEEYR